MLTFKPLKKYKNSAKLAWKTTFYLKQTVASLEFLVSVTHWIDGVSCMLAYWAILIYPYLFCTSKVIFGVGAEQNFALFLLEFN